MPANAARTEVDEIAQRCLEAGFVAARSTIGVDIDGQRLRNTDRVGELDRAAVGKFGGDDILGQITCGVGGGTVDFGRVLARKCAAAVRRRAAVGIDDNLPSGQSGVPIRAADDESPGRIDVKLRLRAHPAFGQDLENVRPDELAHLALAEIGSVLGRYDDGSGTDRLAVFVAQRHLALRVRAEIRCLAGMSVFGHSLQYAMRKMDRRRHQMVGFGTGVTEHDALITGPDVFVAARIHTL